MRFVRSYIVHIMMGLAVLVLAVGIVATVAFRQTACATVCVVWNSQTGSGSRLWYAVAVSSDASKMVAVTGQYNSDGDIYTSSDGGVSWTKADGPWTQPGTPPGTHQWIGVASSADGMHLAAAAQGGDIYTSADGGATWTDQVAAGTRKWSSIASSADGMHLAATVNQMFIHGSTGGDIYTSSDGGVTWTDQTGAGTHNWNSIASSADGMHLAAVAYSFGIGPGDIYTSADGGATWTDQVAAGTRNWMTIASSADGTKLVAAGFGTQIYTSADSGATWTATANSSIWNQVASSADGTHLVITPNNQIYTSDDSGATWTLNTAAGNHPWKTVAISADGSKIVAAILSGTIWTTSFDTAPDAPSSLGPEAFVTGVATNVTQPSFTFSLSDADVADTVKYEVLISTTPDFSSSTVDYSSALGAQGPASFTVGQSAGSGTYALGASGQTLADGSYYLEVKAIDNSGSSSPFTIDNSGAVAFVVDTVAPVLSETVPVPTPSTSPTPSYTFTSSEAGTISYGGGCTSSTTNATAGVNTISFSALDYGTYDGTITVTDAAGNVSAPLSITPFVIQDADTGGSGGTTGGGTTGGGTTGGGEVVVPPPPTSPTPALPPTKKNPASIPPGYVFKKSLSFGVNDPDVTALQKYLNTHGFTVASSGPGSSGSETSFFGVLTQQALVRLQETHAVEILLPVGLSKGSGFFGPSTIQYVNATD